MGHALSPRLGDGRPWTGEVVVTFKMTTLPWSQRLLKTHLLGAAALQGPAEEQTRRKVPVFSPNQSVQPGYVCTVERPAQNSQLLRGSCIMYRSRIDPSAPCQGGIKGPGGWPAAPSAWRHRLLRPACRRAAAGNPLPVSWQSPVGTLLPTPPKCPISLFFCQAQI